MGGQAKPKKKNKPRRKENTSNEGPGLPDLSPQERMKVRMHQKAKKKTAEKYSVQQLIEKHFAGRIDMVKGLGSMLPMCALERVALDWIPQTEECMDSFDFKMAALFCQRALDLEPDNLQTLDMLGHIYSELGDIQKAKGVFMRAVELSPEQGHSKYMYLGQIHTGQEAVDYYSRGLQVLLAALDEQAQSSGPSGAKAGPDEESDVPTAKDVCSACCSIAEIYLTDLCMEEGAADKCKESIEKALHYDRDNPEALQLMASFMFSAERNQEGKEYLLRSVGAWLPAVKQREAEEQHTQNDVPPYESRITSAKLLMESEEYEMAVDVLECLLEEDDEVVQVWYLSGWVCYLQMERAREQRVREEKEASEEEREECEALREAARSYLTRAKKLYSKLRCDDQPMLEHVEQLLSELGGEKDDEEEDEPDLDDEDYEPDSDEEEGAVAPMEH